MFYGQCWKCGERWELGTASACKCPDEEPVKFAFRENNDSTEVLRVTPEGEFIWHEDADRMIEEGDFSQSPALPHILKVLRKQRHEQEPVAWVCMKGEEHDIDFDQSEIDAIPVGTFLYTTPPQSTWQSLTDEEMMDAIYVDDTPMERGRRVEAKLRSKNNV